MSIIKKKFKTIRSSPDVSNYLKISNYNSNRRIIRPPLNQKYIRELWVWVISCSHPSFMLCYDIHTCVHCFYAMNGKKWHLRVKRARGKRKFEFFFIHLRSEMRDGQLEFNMIWLRIRILTSTNRYFFMNDFQLNRFWFFTLITFEADFQLISRGNSWKLIEWKSDNFRECLEMEKNYLAETLQWFFHSRVRARVNHTHAGGEKIAFSSLNRFRMFNVDLCNRKTTSFNRAWFIKFMLIASLMNSNSDGNNKNKNMKFSSRMSARIF